MRKQFVDTFPLTAREEQALRDAEKAARERDLERDSGTRKERSSQ